MRYGPSCVRLTPRVSSTGYDNLKFLVRLSDATEMGGLLQVAQDVYMPSGHTKRWLVDFPLWVKVEAARAAS